MAKYLTQLGCKYYFQRGFAGKQLRTSLRTEHRDTARRWAELLYVYTNQLKRLGLQLSEVSRLTRVRIEQLREQLLMQGLVLPAIGLK